MDLQKTAIAKIQILKAPVKPFCCAFRDGKATGNETPCEVVGCTGVFQKMPPMVEGQLLPCYTDSKTGKSGEQISMEMQERTVVPFRKVS